jgi:hypothetical protein
VERKEGTGEKEEVEQEERQWRWDEAVPVEVWAMILRMAGKERAGLMARVCQGWREIVRVAFYSSSATEGPPRWEPLKHGSKSLRKLISEQNYAEYMKARKAAWPPVLYARSAVESVALVNWAREEGVPWDKRLFAIAARNGSPEVLVYLRANGCPWNASACKAAASGGRLANLRLLRANGCPWDRQACEAAAQNGHLEVLEFLHANGCRSDWKRGQCSSPERAPRRPRVPYMPAGARGTRKRARRRRRTGISTSSNSCMRTVARGTRRCARW